MQTIMAKSIRESTNISEGEANKVEGDVNYIVWKVKMRALQKKKIIIRDYQE